ncbi:hypothetical protein BGZ94_006337 [Podila epigama]|nr:hypothetical protein BGZ94_006337 [Podila epigama]
MNTCSFIRSLTKATVACLALGLLMMTSVDADSLEFVKPSPNTKLVPGQLVPVQYKVHHNGLAQLRWAKVHLMTANGYDSGLGTFNTVFRSEWQDTLTVSTDFEVPATLPAGNYVLHVFGSTQQPCEGAVDFSRKCEGVLSETLPVQILDTPAKSNVNANVDSVDNTQPTTVTRVLSLASSLLRKRSMYDGRDTGISPSEFTLANGSPDTQKMLYMFSLI